MRFAPGEPAFGGNRRGGIPAGQSSRRAGALAPAHFNQVHARCVWTDMRDIHTVRTTTTTTSVAILAQGLGVPSIGSARVQSVQSLLHRNLL